MSDAPPLISTRHAMFLDFDGTLAPIQDDPDSVALPDGGAGVLLRLFEQLGGAMAVVSGRDLRDLSSRVPLALWRAGGHGVEICAPGEPPSPEADPAPARLIHAISDIIGAYPGVRLENKGKVLAIHYRQAPQAAEPMGAALDAALETFDDYQLERGKMIYEAKPASADKGKALRHLMKKSPFDGRAPIMIGDDTTDEAAMEAAMELGGFAVKVGEGKSLASYRLNGPADVWAWLEGGATA